jgi:hypothetical protein
MLGTYNCTGSGLVRPAVSLGERALHSDVGTYPGVAYLGQSIPGARHIGASALSRSCFKSIFVLAHSTSFEA